ncbi:MAG: hypothetical protein IPK80_36035 [Nannocystis sp.]|nr:hypothetical protein [Nannocystis sp.]
MVEVDVVAVVSEVVEVEVASVVDVSVPPVVDVDVDVDESDSVPVSLVELESVAEVLVSSPLQPASSAVKRERQAEI